MPKNLEEVRQLVATYKPIYAERHDAFKKLRRYWQGEYWQLAKESSNSQSISSIFRDLGRHSGAPPLNVQVVHNVIQQVCVKYQTFLSPLPQIRMYVDPPESSTRKEQAAKKERYLYGVWATGRMSQVMRQVAWYMPLMGDAFVGMYPDFDRSVPIPVLRSPEVTFPVPTFGGGGDEAYVFHWQERDSVLKAKFPDYVSNANTSGGKLRRGQPSDPMVDVYEYSDCYEFSRWAGEQNVNSAQHEFGFNLFEHTKFIDVPGETWGHGAVEQAVNLNEASNLLSSMLIAAVYENVFPTLKLIDPAKAPEEIVRGPGSVIPLNAGGDAEYIVPPVQALPVQLGFLQSMRQSILEAGSMSNVDFGQSPVSSILTGAAVNELQGAGTGSTVEMVQGSLGLALSLLNEKAGVIQQTLFRDDQVTLYSSAPQTALDLKPKQGSTTIRGRELIGGWRNEIIFSPAMSQHDKLVMWLQAKGGGLVSDQFIREQIGIPDNEAMEEEIVGEEIQRAVLGFILQALTDPSQAPGVEAQAIGVIEGTAVVRAGPPPTAPPAALAAPTGPGAGGGPPVIPLGGGGAAQAPALNLPPGAPQQQGGPPPQAPVQGAGAATVPLQVAESQLAKAQISGKAWLVGQIVAQGQAAQVEVALTDPADKQPLADAAKFPIVFHVVRGKPAEASVEITTAQPVAA